MDKNKKILIATGIYPPDTGGPATYVTTLFKELPQKGIDLKVVTYSDQIESIEENVYKVSRKNNLLVRYVKYFFQVFKLIKWADIVYIQGLVSEGLPAYLVCRLYNKKYILKIVGDYAWEQGRQRFSVQDNLDDFQNKKYSWQVELMRKVQKIVSKKADKIITPSQYLKNIVAKWGIDENKIKVIYNSVKVINLKEDKNKLREKYGLKGEIILSMGRFVPWKGFEILIRLVPNLIADRPNLKLVIVGDGPEFSKYEKLIKDLNLEENVILTGRMDQQKFWEYIKASDMFVLNTGYEGLSHVIIEAMSLALPVVSTKVGGNPELIENKKTGILVEYNNKDQLKKAILGLLDSYDEANKLGQNAKEKIEKSFDQKNMIEELVKII